MRRRRGGAGVVPILLLVTVALGAAWMGANRAQVPVADRADAGDGTATSVWAVVSVTDGDTLVVSQGGLEERVRLLGIDTPEVAQCGYPEATAAMAGLVQGGDVTLVVGSADDRDQYDRLLRYVEVDVAGETVDIGLRMLESGLAAEIYDSRTGYARHDREDAYIAADEAAPDLCPDMREH